MVLIAIDLTYLYALWDTFFLYSATVVLAYGCGLAHGIIGILLMQYIRKERPTSSTQTNAMTGDEDQAQPDHSRKERERTTRTARKRNERSSRHL